jgi:hypothetical protein
MTTMALTVAAVRKILNDRPVEDLLGAAVASDSTTAITPTDVTLYAKGNVWEFADGTDGAEMYLVRSVDDATPVLAVKRGHEDSTAVTHSNGAVMVKDPRFRYNTVAQAVNTTLDASLYEDGVYDLIEHQVTSNSDGSQDYNAPASTCEEFLAVYQKLSTMDAPEWFGSSQFTRYPKNVDTSLHSNGKVFFIKLNLGTPGTDIFYITCAHRLTITTLTATQERIVQWLACAYLLEWTEPRRTAGPTNQGDRTVRPGQAVGTAAYYRQLAERTIAAEKARLRKLNPPKKEWRR